ncbi:hypothetical protein ATANTOWER_017080 [Ataeniobius toweri]|uniref:Uncharacterized protein n=1 Tax=Ataeniobius toweri TaxID=208326 RepID=A0ABU7AG45_9TELE|nr:hypothetical protein [Ataeniobius toweri]
MTLDVSLDIRTVWNLGLNVGNLKINVHASVIEIYSFVSILFTEWTYHSINTVSHQSAIFYRFCHRGEAGAYLQQSMGGRRGTPWTGHQSIAGTTYKTLKNLMPKFS